MARKRKTLFDQAPTPLIAIDAAPLSPTSAHRQLMNAFSQSINRALGQSNDQSNYQSTKKRRIDPDDEEAEETEQYDEEIDQSNEQSEDEADEELDDEKDEQSEDEQTNEQPLNQSTHQSNTDDEESEDELAAVSNDNDDASFFDDDDQSTNLSTNQSVNQSTNPIIKQTISQLDEIEVDSTLAVKLCEPKALQKISPLPTFKEQIFVSINQPNNQSAAQDNQTTEQILGIPPVDAPLTLSDCLIAPKIAKQWSKHIAPKLSKMHTKALKRSGNQSVVNQPVGEFAHPFVRQFLPILSTYRDVVFPSVPVNQSTVQSTLCLHALNHALKKRNTIIKHNQSINAAIKRSIEQAETEREAMAKLPAKERKALQKSKQAINATINQSLNQSNNAIPEYRDQGFTRCSVLILVPFANTAYSIINTMLQLLPESMNVGNKSRFEREFGPTTVVDPETKEAVKQKVDPSKPASYRAIFDGNLNDAVRIGLSLSANQIKLYSSFYAADIIVATPLGLRMIVGSEGDAPHSRDWDFLSSLDMLIIEQSDVIAHQNWSHLTHLFQYINQLPSQQKNQSSLADINRIRSETLNGLSRHFRQSIVCSYESHSELSALVRSSVLSNKRGCVMFRASVQHGTLAQTNTQTTGQTIKKQAFHRLPCRSLSSASEDRFQFFVENVWPRLYREHNETGGCCIFVSHYFDFLKLRNWLRSKHYSFAGLSEYSSNADLSRHRANFFHGRRKFLLITERLQYFRRYRIRGCHLVCFYSLPQCSELYADMVNHMEQTSDAQSTHVLALFNKFDAIPLENVVGTQRATKLLTGDKDTHLFA